MKKLLMVLITLLTSMTSYVNAESKIVFIKTAPIIRPKSPQPEPPALILGEYDDEQLTISITGYDGDITITITKVSHLL